LHLELTPTAVAVVHYAKTMTTVWQYKTSGRLSQTLSEATRPIPVPGDGEVLVEIKAAGLNPADEQL
jgi:D-arabinose 1-dehydrogenase-like Zn-dependent alcohol dehydrogenase